jgi:hypothetical protein
MRWVAVIAWAAAAVFVFLRMVVFAEFPMIPNDAGPAAICLAPAVLIAIGGQIGVRAAIVSIGLAGLTTLAFAILSASGWGSWLATAGAAVLTLVTYLAAREMNRTVPA